MWTVGNKPTIAEALGDIDPLVDHCNNLNNGHKPLLVKLYRQYHVNRGFATAAELSPLDGVKGVIEGQYKSKMTGDKTLGYVRRELNDNVEKCPMCSINETTQLDHFMNEGTYGQLACCRLNLVPACGRCNLLKHDGSYTDFVHAYYDRYPNVDFLITTITVKNNKVGMVFSIDQNALGNGSLARRTLHQFTTLDLTKRLHKAGIMFLNDLLGGYRCTNNNELRADLMSSELDMRSRYGRNDWRTSILRGLIANPAFNIEVVNAIRNPMRLQPVNGGGA